MDNRQIKESTELAQPEPSTVKIEPKKVRSALMTMLTGAGTVAILVTATGCPGAPVQYSLPRATQPASMPVMIDQSPQGGIKTYQLSTMPMGGVIAENRIEPIPQEDKGEDK